MLNSAIPEQIVRSMMDEYSASNQRDAIYRQIKVLENRAWEYSRQISHLRTQLSGIETQIAELEKQLRELDSFRVKVLTDWDTIRGHVSERSKLVDMLVTLDNDGIVAKASQRLNENIGNTMRSGVEKNLSSVYGKVQSAIRQVQMELEEARAHRQSLKNEISANQNALNTCSQQLLHAQTQLASL